MKHKEGREWYWCSECTTKNNPEAKVCGNCYLRYKEPEKKKKWKEADRDRLSAKSFYSIQLASYLF